MRNSEAGRLLLVALLMAGRAAAEVKPTMRPDYSKLQYKGDMVSGHRQDSFALAVQAAARLLGRETDYETITAMAGNAFAPFRNLEEDCTSHGQLEAVYSDRAMATVAAYVGLKARKLELPAVEGSDVKDVDRLAYLATVARVVRDTMDAGEVVIVLQGWKVKGGPHGFTHWGYAGIATEADPETGRILGAHLNGHKDNPIHHGSVMWAVAPGEVTLKSPEAEQTMLRQAVDYIRGRGLFAPKEPVVYGLAAMDAWINHMQTVQGYCAPCWGRGQKSWHDAMENGERLLRGARVAAKKLRAMDHPYEAAAKHYDRIAELLAPVKYQEFIGDLDKQKAHAETVLKPVKAELAAAADDMGKALTQMETVAGGRPDAAEVKLAGGKRRTWVEGFTAPGVLRPLVQFLGAEGGFAAEGDWYSTEIFPLFMGVCGDAFRFVWYRQDGTKLQRGDEYTISPPGERYLPALDAAGFDARVAFDPALTGTPATLPWDAASLRREVVSSIAERKWPVLLVDLPEPGWNALITGYENGGETLIGWCEEGWESFGFRFDPARKRKFKNWFPGVGGAVLLSAKHARPAEADVLRAALARAVPELRRRAAGCLHAGPATYEVLAERLGDDALSVDDDATAAKRQSLLFPTIWDLATQRHYAAEFLKHAAEVFPAAAEELKAASALFVGIHDAVWEINRLGGGKQPGSPLPRTIDPAVRKQIAGIILKCRERDLEAAKKIEEALQKKANPKVVAANTLRLDGMKARRSYVSQVSCLKVCLDYLGADVSMAWLCGGTGQAFFVNVHGDVDCAGPTGWNEEPIRELAANLGARVTTGVFVSKKDAGPDYPAWQRKAYDFVRGRIDRGIPCYGHEVWPWIPDWQAICGYDDVGYHCLSGMGPVGPNPWQDLGDRDIKKIQVFSVERCTAADDAKTVHDACAAALAHAGGVPRYGTAVTGPAAFEHWAQKLGNGEAERDAGAYNGAYYHECRTLAVEFLQEAKRRLPGRSDTAFDEAIAQYGIVRDQLTAFLKICPERGNADWKARFQSKEGAEVMRTAAAAEQRGLEALKTIAAALGKSP